MRELADAGHYPAIDIEQSASRVMHGVVAREHFALAREFKATLARYNASRTLLQVGAYVAGSDPALDRAIALSDGMQQYLQQDMHESATLVQSLQSLAVALRNEAQAGGSR
ncbi:MAG: hypothetical protein EBS99_03230 [Betaproteobacteria bacterium]|nr:hypothetical protein [Betaproteobacteria bacterium]